MLRIFRTRWHDPDLDRMSAHYRSTSSRDLILITMWEVRKLRKQLQQQPPVDDPALQAMAEQLDASSNKVEKTIEENQTPNFVTSTLSEISTISSA